MRKGRERYVFVFDQASFDETSRTFARFANDRDLSFSWHDATVLGEYLRKLRANSSNTQDNDEKRN